MTITCELTLEEAKNVNAKDLVLGLLSAFHTTAMNKSGIAIERRHDVLTVKIFPKP